MDPTRLARFFDQDWMKASYGVSNANNNNDYQNQPKQMVSPYISLDLDRPRSRLEASVSLNLSQKSYGGDNSLNNVSNILDDSGMAMNPALTESGRPVGHHHAPLSTMAGVTTSIPSLPDTNPTQITRIPETDEQIGSNVANKTLRQCRSNGDVKTQAVFKDSKFMFGFCSRQTAEIITPRSIPPPIEQLGRVCTVDERRNELFLNKSIREAETMVSIFFYDCFFNVSLKFVTT